MLQSFCTQSKEGYNFFWPSIEVISSLARDVVVKSMTFKVDSQDGGAISHCQFTLSDGTKSPEFDLTKAGNDKAQTLVLDEKTKPIAKITGYDFSDCFTLLTFFDQHESEICKYAPKDCSSTLKTMTLEPNERLIGFYGYINEGKRWLGNLGFVVRKIQ